MDSGEESSGLVKQKATKLLPHDVKEMEAFSKYAKNLENKMQKLTNDVDQMGKIKCIWDSKVPEINKRFYYFFSLKESNNVEIKEDIQKYLDFYEQMSAVVLNIHNWKEAQDSDKDIYTVILDLYEDLTELSKAAEMGKKTTGSSTVYDLHKEFISKHEKLENMLKRVECVALKQSWKHATEDLQQSLKAIDGLRDDVKASNSKYDDLCEKFENLLSENKKLIKQQNFLLEENAKVMKQQQTLLENNKHMKEQTERLIDVIRSIAASEKENKRIKDTNDEQ